MPLTIAGQQTNLNRAYKYAGVTIHGVLFDVNLYSATVTATVVGNLINSAAHGLVNGVRVRLASTGSLPSPLLANTNYFVVGSTTGNYQLASALGGSAIALSTTGAGTITATEQSPGAADPLAVWVRHEVNYRGSARQVISFAAVNPVNLDTGWAFPPQIVRFSPTTASITYRFYGVIMDGTATAGNTTGHLHYTNDYQFSLTIASGSSADIGWTPTVASGT